MNTITIITLAVAVLIVLGLALVLTSVKRNDARGVGTLKRETRRKDVGKVNPDEVSGRAIERAAVAARNTAIATRPSADVEPWSPPDAEAVGVARRQFLNRATGSLLGASLGAFGASLIAFLWTSSSGGFGSKINIGNLDTVIGQIRATYGAQAAVYGGMEAGIIALYQKCPHLGCRVPNCVSSQWFECPCHGSQYNIVGEKKGGPAPRGMDRFGVSVANDIVVVDTGSVFGGPPIGTNTTGQEAEGPHCVGTAGSH